LGIGDWAQSPIPNPQSPIPNPQYYLINGIYIFINKIIILFPINTNNLNIKNLWKIIMEAILVPQIKKK